MLVSLQVLFPQRGGWYMREQFVRLAILGSLSAIVGAVWWVWEASISLPMKVCCTGVAVLVIATIGHEASE